MGSSNGQYIYGRSPYIVLLYEVSICYLVSEKRPILYIRGNKLLPRTEMFAAATILIRGNKLIPRMPTEKLLLLR